MYPTWKGFEGDNVESQDTSDSHPEYSPESSDQEASTPERAYEREDGNTVRRGRNRLSVRELVGHFSQSDSETGETERTSRRRSNNLEHTEIPPGGEREINRRVKMQTNAELAMKIRSTQNKELKEDMKEASKSLDNKGHLAGLNSTVRHMLGKL